VREGRFSDKNSEFYRDDSGLFDLPGGGLDWGEEFRHGLTRELAEEVGLKHTDTKIAKEPLYVQITELDDRYFDDREKDDFYPTCMMYYPVKIAHTDFHESPECTGFEWVSIDEYKNKPLWTHSATLSKIFHLEDFPKEFIS
jgi:8-oxo-dGTP diphosphatase